MTTLRPASILLSLAVMSALAGCAGESAESISETQAAADTRTPLETLYPGQRISPVIGDAYDTALLRVDFTPYDDAVTGDVVITIDAVNAADCKRVTGASVPWQALCERSAADGAPVRLSGEVDVRRTSMRVGDVSVPHGAYGPLMTDSGDTVVHLSLIVDNGGTYYLNSRSGSSLQDPTQFGARIDSDKSTLETLEEVAALIDRNRQ